MKVQTIKRVGIDARMLATNPSGVGNYIATLLRPMCISHPNVQFFLYSNSQVGFEPGANLIVKEGGARIGPIWLNFQIPAMLRRDGIDVFWGANGVVPVLGNVPSVVTVHDMVYRFAGETMGRGARWTKRVFQSRSVERAVKTVAVSRATAADIAKIYRRSVDAVISPIPNDLFRRQDDATVDEVVLRYQLPARYWMFVGTLEPRKNLVAFLGAYFRARAEGFDLPVIAMAGNPGWGDGRLNELITEGHETGCIVRLSYVPVQDLACLYAGCEVLWMPSIYEGFGMPLLEAQRCGAAVVHGNHPSMVEASAGLGVPTGTSEEELYATVVAVASGVAALSCRTEKPSQREASDASDRLWSLLCSAASPHLVSG